MPQNLPSYHQSDLSPHWPHSAYVLSLCCVFCKLLGGSKPHTKASLQPQPICLSSLWFWDMVLSFLSCMCFFLWGLIKQLREMEAQEIWKKIHLGVYMSRKPMEDNNASNGSSLRALLKLIMLSYSLWVLENRECGWGQHKGHRREGHSEMNT